MSTYKLMYVEAAMLFYLLYFNLTKGMKTAAQWSR